jgi:hypothetical protein
MAINAVANPGSNGRRLLAHLLQIKFQECQSETRNNLSCLSRYQSTRQHDLGPGSGGIIIIRAHIGVFTWNQPWVDDLVDPQLSRFHGTMHGKSHAKIVLIGDSR